MYEIVFHKKKTEEGDGYPERFVSSLISNFKMRESMYDRFLTRMSCQMSNKKKRRKLIMIVWHRLLFEVN